MRDFCKVYDSMLSSCQVVELVLDTKVIELNYTVSVR